MPSLKTLLLERLDLSNREEEPLAALKALGQSLQELVIKDCQLKRLPEWFGQSLTGLTSLVLSGNDMWQLPGSFSRLQQLQVRRQGRGACLAILHLFSEIIKCEKKKILLQ